MGPERRSDGQDIDRRVRALSGGGMTDAAARATSAIPGIPRDDDGPVFREPWEAQAFAMALTLHERGLFTWSEWAATLADEIKRAQAGGDPDTGETYYRHWLATLERLVAEKGVASSATLRRYHEAWDHAADRTPHGSPIELRPEDFS
jgi:nitrile hydratase accessory protein